MDPKIVKAEWFVKGGEKIQATPPSAGLKVAYDLHAAI
jgi:hypothetical protein